MDPLYGNNQRWNEWAMKPSRGTLETNALTRNWQLATGNWQLVTATLRPVSRRIPSRCGMRMSTRSGRRGTTKQGREQQHRMTPVSLRFIRTGSCACVCSLTASIRRILNEYLPYFFPGFFPGFFF